MKFTRVAFIVIPVAIAAIAIFFLFRNITIHRTIEHRFIEELVDVRGNQGNVLEVAILKTAATFSDSDKLQVDILGLPLSIANEFTITIPVTY